MAPRRINRFVDQTAPAEGSSSGSDLQSIEKKYSLDQAVSLFKTERTKSSMLRDACNKAEIFLSSGQVGNNLGNLSSLNYDSKVAIVAFTLESPNVYMDFNSLSRKLSTSSWSSFPYKGMWLLLNKAILSHGELSSSLTVYRGIKPLIDAAPNKCYCFRQITSTSISRQVAEDFSGDLGTMFIPKISRGLSIRALSYDPTEEEYILPAFDSFVVKKVDNIRSYREIYLEA